MSEVDLPDDEVRAQTLSIMQTYQALLAARRFDEWIELWADNGICEFPYAQEGRPRRLEGKAQIYEYMSAYPDRITIDGVDELKVHPMVDPRAVTVELAITGTAIESGRPYNQRYVIVARTDRGRIVEYREYWNPLVSIEAFGEQSAARSSYAEPMRTNGGEQ